MMRKQLEYHNKRKNKLFDYYIEDRNGIKEYIFAVDGREKYRDEEPLTHEEIQRFMTLYSF